MVLQQRNFVKHVINWVYLSKKELKLFYTFSVALLARSRDLLMIETARP